MNKRYITAVALKFFALYILIELLNVFTVHGMGVIYTVHSWLGGQPGTVFEDSHLVLLFLINILALSVPVAAAFFVWKRADKLAAEAELEPALEKVAEGLRQQDAMDVVLIGIGLWVAITSFPEAASSLTRMVVESQHTKSGLEGKVTADTLVWFLGAVFKIILGISLVLGRRGWSGALIKMRRGSV